MVCQLLEFCESILGVWSKRERRFLSAWGAVGQAQGRWGTDMGNVAYATAWHHLLQEADTAKWPRCRQITGRVASGDVVETLFGVMYLSDLNVQTYSDFVEEATIRRMQAYEDVYESTFEIIKRNEENFKLVTQYRFALETYVYGWHHLLFEARSEWRTIFVQHHHNATWNAKEILIAFEVMRLGHPVALLEMFKKHPLPPPSATVWAKTWVKYF